MTQKYPINTEWFRLSLKEQGKSVRGLARFMGMDVAAISRMLNGQRNMSAAEQDMVAAFLGFGIADVASHRGMAKTGFEENKQEPYAAEGAFKASVDESQMLTESDIIWKDGGRWIKSSGKLVRLHPIFGCMKGTMTVPADLDLTVPADPDWGEVYEDD